MQTYSMNQPVANRRIPSQPLLHSANFLSTAFGKPKRGKSSPAGKISASWDDGFPPHMENLGYPANKPKLPA